MSTPMFDVPEHFPLPVNADGEGPLDADETPARIVCWCGNPGCFWTRALAEQRAAIPADRTMRYFIEDQAHGSQAEWREVSAQQAGDAEVAGLARVIRGGSGVVPERYRAPAETEADWLRPWIVLAAIPPTNVPASGAGAEREVG